MGNENVPVEGATACPSPHASSEQATHPGHGDVVATAEGDAKDREGTRDLVGAPEVEA